MKRDGLGWLPLSVMAVAVAAAAVSCGEEKADTIADVDTASFPTMTTVDVSTFISDSGYTRYHITAPVWYMYEEAEDPYWHFPEGMHLEKYDDSMNIAATFDADTATYFSSRKLWQFDGLVNTRNVDGDKFLSTQLLWDQARHKVYTDSFIHVERSDRIIEGYGFESNENMTQYEVRNPQMILPVSDFHSRKDTAAAAVGQQPADTVPARIVSSGQSRIKNRP